MNAVFFHRWALNSVTVLKNKVKTKQVCYNFTRFALRNHIVIKTFEILN